MKRTESSIKNLAFAFGGQLVGLMVSYLARIIFIQFLNSEYLGLNGLFTNILTMLSLVEIGIGPAMSFALYKPLAEKNTELLKSLMRLYKKAYILIGAVVLLVGVAITPLLPYFINDMPDIPEINLIYILFVVNTAVSYFYSYKRSLIISDQRRYIATLYRYGFYIGLNIFQMIVLAVTRNYLFFLLAQILFTWLENLFVSLKADRMYPYLKEKQVQKLPQAAFTEIKRNVFAMVFHKIGGIAITAVDSVIISKMVSLIAVGLYSNYQLIIQAIHTVLSQLYNSIIASIGNLGATEGHEKMESILNKTLFVTFWIYGFCSIGLFLLLQPFIALSFGKEFLFSLPAVISIILQFYFIGVRKAVLAFRDATGAYWYDRYKPLAEVALKLIFSIWLAIDFGVAGVMFGTIIAFLLTSFWVEPYVLYKYVLHAKLSSYFKQFAGYTAVVLFAGAITFGACSFVPGTGWGALVLKGIICAILPNVIFCLLFFKTENFRYFASLLRSMLRKVTRKNKSLP